MTGRRCARCTWQSDPNLNTTADEQGDQHAAASSHPLCTGCSNSLRDEEAAVCERCIGAVARPEQPRSPRDINTLAHAATDLDELMTTWPRLVEALEPGTRRRWIERQQDLDAEGQPVPQPTATRCPDCRTPLLRTPDWETRDPSGQLQQSGAGKLYCPRGCDEQPLRPGYTRSPIADDQLSVMVSVSADLAWLEDDVREKLGFIPLDEHDPVREAHRHRHGVPRLAGRDAMAAATWLRDALPALTEHADLARHVADELSRLRRTVRRSLGDTEDVHPIKAPCPICSCMSLRAFPERELIVCVNDRCRCSEAGCPCTSTSHPQRHRWTRDRWPWLAQVLGVDLEPAKAAAS